MNHGKCAGRPETCTLLRRKGRKRRGKLGKAGGSVQEGGEHAHFSGETGRNRGKTGGSVRGCIETCTLLRRKGRKRRGKLGEAGGSVHDSPETCTLLRRKGRKRRGKLGKAGGSVQEGGEHAHFSGGKGGNGGESWGKLGEVCRKAENMHTSPEGRAETEGEAGKSWGKCAR